jgi:hypothetical protein
MALNRSDFLLMFNFFLFIAFVSLSHSFQSNGKLFKTINSKLLLNYFLDYFQNFIQLIN